MRSAPGASASGGAKVVVGADGTRVNHVAGSAGSGVRSGVDAGGRRARTPVWGEARTGDADAKGRADDERSEAN